MFAGDPAPFVMELPNYRFPSARSVCQLIWEKARDFLQKAFTVIFAATIVIWFLQNFKKSLKTLENPVFSRVFLIYTTSYIAL